MTTQIHTFGIQILDHLPETLCEVIERLVDIDEAAGDRPVMGWLTDHQGRTKRIDTAVDPDALDDLVLDLWMTVQAMQGGKAA